MTITLHLNHFLMLQVYQYLFLGKNINKKIDNLVKDIPDIFFSIVKKSMNMYSWAEKTNSF